MLLASPNYHSTLAWTMFPNLHTASYKYSSMPTKPNPQIRCTPVFSCKKLKKRKIERNAHWRLDKHNNKFVLYYILLYVMCVTTIFMPHRYTLPWIPTWVDRVPSPG
jgi:hypothetical protein